MHTCMHSFSEWATCPVSCSVLGILWWSNARVSVQCATCMGPSYFQGEAAKEILGLQARPWHKDVKFILTLWKSESVASENKLTLKQGWRKRHVPHVQIPIHFGQLTNALQLSLRQNQSILQQKGLRKVRLPLKTWTQLQVTWRWGWRGQGINSCLLEQQKRLPQQQIQLNQLYWMLTECPALYYVSFFSFFFLNILFIYFLETRRNINVWLPLARPLLGTWPATQACALTGNRTGDPLVCKPLLNPLSHTSQGMQTLCFIGMG